ncbi:hypothetical protein NG798_15715 [Ancylothrix sp. C2]|uniref:WD40 domain-containing protein n=1 Tax=Ancylothrix sp. D3o TaxID=2953691 RepID=UPI0021BAC22D|nr:hypothetical protein [Ancylothrix sp. D3o]MCT7951247.1 hypothetical protein [Ancylothrix sp. D3o]
MLRTYAGILKLELKCTPKAIGDVVKDYKDATVEAVINGNMFSYLELQNPSPMTDRLPLDYVSAYNKRSLKILARALTLAMGQFSLILVRCNYGSLQPKILQQLSDLIGAEAQSNGKNSFQPVNLHKIVVSSPITSLYDCMKQGLANRPSALIISGFESVNDLDRLLKSTNQLREEIKQNFSLPVVLWLSDEVMQKFVRFAPDFKSWAACSIKFEINTPDLIKILRAPASELLARCLNPNDNTADPLTNNSQELLAALRDCQKREIRLEPATLAGVEFALGVEASSSDKLEIALKHYQNSAAVWKQAISEGQTSENQNLDQHLLWFAVILYHLGLAYAQKADRHPLQSSDYLIMARSSLQECLQKFETADRPDLLAKFSDALGEVLRRLQAWDELLAVAQKAVLLAHTHAMMPQLARYYGFLAEVCLVRSQWEEAEWAAQQALEISNALPANDQTHHALYLFLLAKALRGSLDSVGNTKRRKQGFSLSVPQLFLPSSYKKSTGISQAIAYLEEAKAATTPGHDPELYINILQELWFHYFEIGKFAEAFRCKQQLRTVEHQYGRRAFIGAGQLQPVSAASPLAIQQRLHPTLKNGLNSPACRCEIEVSCRSQDVKRLLQRLARNDCKLTIIYGKSGVGKSSLVNAGLVPALQGRVIGDRVAVPVVLRVYTDWSRALGQQLGVALSEIRHFSGERLPLDTLDSVIEQLRKNAAQNLLTVLVFDQFEEFFFVCNQASQEPVDEELRPFFDFLRECLNIPFVKVILSMREDYLHYLLDWERLGSLDAVNNNILDKDIRYHVGYFSAQDTKDVILALTQRSRVFLEEALIDALVEDLAGSSGKVRPIELQVVGAQLQEEKITTEEQYRKKGPKIKLVERWLQQVIADCGKENENAAWEVLALLTGSKDSALVEERNIRPLKTKSELAANLTFGAKKLNLILEILVGSGLLFLHREKPADRYQLVHDYLVHFIRASQESRVKLQQREQLKRSEKQKLLLAGVGGFFLLLTFLTGGFWLRAEALKQKAEDIRKQAEIAEIDANIRAKVAYSELLYVSHQELEALLESLRAQKALMPVKDSQPDNRIRVLTALQQAVYGVRERNRLEGHQDSIWAVSFSGDGELIASGGNDKTVKVWRRDGSVLATLEGHTESVTRVVWGHNTKILASASRDTTVKLWDLKSGFPVLQKTLKGHKDFVFGVAFSPDEKLIATASKDKTVKLWDKQGLPVLTLQGHKDAVNFVQFSPDGKLIASASNDGTVKLWQRDGKLVRTWRGHNNWILGVSFSPNGNVIATAGRDNLVKLWTKEGRLIKSLSAHESAVYAVSWRADGKMFATASDDQTVKIWSVSGELLKTLNGHSGRVTGVSWSPDGTLIASGSLDKTVKLWGSEQLQVPVIAAHGDRLTSLKFSPDGRFFVTASRDKSLKLWSREGVLLKTMAGHTDRVTSVVWSPDGNLIASGSMDKTVKFWSKDGELLRTFAGHSNSIYAVKFSPDGRFLATGSKDKTVKLWTLGGELIRTFSGHANRIYGVTFSPDGSKIASASDDTTVKIWSLDGTLLRTLAGEDGHRSYVTSVSWSPDGNLLATGSWDNTVKLWPVAGGKPKTLLKGYSDSVTSVEFSPDGKTLASGSWDGRVKLWSLEGFLLKELKWSDGGVLDIDFSFDGKFLAAATAEGKVILWSLDWDNLVDRACVWLGDYLQTNPNVNPADRLLCSEE